MSIKEKVTRILKGGLVPGSFEKDLINAIMLSDLQNRKTLAKVCPEHVQAVNEWQGYIKTKKPIPRPAHLGIGKPHTRDDCQRRVIIIPHTQNFKNVKGELPMTVSVAQETGLNMIECLQCGEEMGREDAFLGPDDKHYCEDCYDDLFITCERCEDVVPRDDDVMEVEGETWCEYCAGHHAVECDHCRELVRHEHTYRDYDVTICDECFENSYTTCTACESIVHIDDAHFEHGDSYCPDCIPEEEEQVIYDWDEGPPLTFYRSHDQSRVFYGVELEVERCDSPVDRYDMALTIYDMASQLYCKRDGSLDDGIEIVSHPADYEYHMKRLPWGDVLNRLVEEGYRSHDAGTCGLHIHINREAFGQERETQLDRIHRLLYIVEKFWPYWLKFSRRTEDSMRQWAARYLGDHEHPDRVPKEILLDRAIYGSKYHAVNLQKPRTVEIRMFRGTLKLSTLRATLQLVHYLVGLVNNDDIDLEKLTWDDIANDLRNLTPELKQYMEERGL